MRTRYQRITYNPLLALQALIPRSGLDHTESLTIAEVQATALLKMVGVIQRPVPVLILYEHLDVGTECDPTADVVGYHRLRATLLRKHHVAEYFAQCLTLPGRFVQQGWCRGDRDVEQLAELFGVSTASMLFRLKTLRLVEPGCEL